MKIPREKGLVEDRGHVMVNDTASLLFFKFIYFEGEYVHRGGAERESQAGSALSAQSLT